MDQPISSIMQKIVNPAAMDDTVDDVERILNSHDFSCVPVVADNGAVVGILTSRDLLHFHATGKDPKAIHAWEICHYKPIEVSPDTAIKEVAELMLNNKIHHIVVAQNGSMKGVVSSLDFVRLLVSQSNQ